MSRPNKELILCTRCGGSGSVRFTTMNTVPSETTCPRCAGTGRLLVDPTLPLPRSENSDTIGEILEEFRFWSR